MTDDNGDDVQPSDHPHRDLDAADLRRTTKAFACSCASYAQSQCAYFRMGYCTDRNGYIERPQFKRPTLVIDNTAANVVPLRK